MLLVYLFCLLKSREKTFFFAYKDKGKRRKRRYALVKKKSGIVGGEKKVLGDPKVAHHGEMHCHALLTIQLEVFGTLTYFDNTKC